jgi:hypothetical protein
MSNIRVVTSCYNDEKKLLWIPELLQRNISYIIYRKNDNIDDTHTPLNISNVDRCKKFDPNLKYQCIEIPNIGRCDYAFIRHIIANYENLDDITIFVKSNWHEYNIPFWNVIDNCIEYDYVNMGTHPENPYNYSENLSFNVGGKNIDSRTTWYNHLFDNDIPKSNNIRIWGHGPCFSVSRKLIRRHPKSVYEFLLERLIIPYKICHDKKLINEIGIVYHNEMQRFYSVLFTYNLTDNEYVIYPNSIIPEPNDTNTKDAVYKNQYNYKTRKVKYGNRIKMNIFARTLI